MFVGRAHAGQIGPYRVLPVTPFYKPIMRWRGRGNSQLIDNLRQIISVASLYGRKVDFSFRNLSEDSGWRIERNVGPVEADCEEEGLIMTSGNLLDGPARVGAVLKEVFFCFDADVYALVQVFIMGSGFVLMLTFTRMC